MIAQTPTGLMLLDLPDEVLICIFGFLDFRALGRASLACKHFADLAEPFKYRGIEITTGHQASGLASALHDKPNRATWIRSLLISTKFGDDHGLVNLPPHLTLMSNLEHLCLETPDCNAKVPEERVNWVSLQERYERVFEAASAVVPKGVERVLPHLKTCMLLLSRFLGVLTDSESRHIAFRGWDERDLLYAQIRHALLAPDPEIVDHVLRQYGLPLSTTPPIPERREPQEID